MAVAISPRPTPTATELLDRLSARAFTLSVLAEATATATAELLDIVNGDSRLLRAAHERFVRLAREHPDSAPTDRALALVTHAWLAARAAA